MTTTQIVSRVVAEKKQQILQEYRDLAGKLDDVKPEEIPFCVRKAVHELSVLRTRTKELERRIEKAGFRSYQGEVITRSYTKRTRLSQENESRKNRRMDDVRHAVTVVSLELMKTKDTAVRATLIEQFQKALAKI